ncbi:MAG TPA: hypothetical protein VJ770_24845 [Stellaceae bacterium]|nr:hypothetical protein [Stellaceae bacterium]
MDGIKSGKEISARSISAEEITQRRQALRQADANNRLEGVFREPATNEIFEAHIRGEIDASEMMARLKALPQPR